MYALLLVFGMPPVDAALARQPVICAEVAFSQAAERRDLPAFTARLDADARFVTDAILRGPQAIAEAWAPFFETDGPEIRWRPAVVEVTADGTLAISRGPYRIRSHDEDGRVRETWGTFTSVWRRQPDDSWRVLFDAGAEHGRQPTDEDRRLLERDPPCTTEPPPAATAR